jgi:predicted ATP-grasp superfamily ATP-dependent carboligase
MSMPDLATAMTSQSRAGPVNDRPAYDYDVLVLDAASRQSLATVRSLGRAGLRVAVGECSDDIDPARPVLAFRSRYASRTVVLPSFSPDVRDFTAAVLEFVRGNPTRAIIPGSDRVVGALTPFREQFEALGCPLALPSTSALEIANSKDRTLEVARELGVEYPRSMRISSPDDIPAVLREFTFPFVVKPTASWAPLSAGRLMTVEVIDEAEATKVIGEYLAVGAGVVAQQWVSGRRETVMLLMVDGEVRARFAWEVHRTTPTLGGVSVLRESIPMPGDTYESSVRLVKAIGLDGLCDVEYRRDTSDRPFLMEINARLAGGIETARRCGVDFPLLTWLWATGRSVEHVEDYRVGVRMRWLRGDLRWLRNNCREPGRPDSVSRARAVGAFAAEFARTRHYDCFDLDDVRPALTELRTTIASCASVFRGSRPAS